MSPEQQRPAPLPAELQALGEAGRRRRERHLRHSEAELSKRERARLELSVTPPMAGLFRAGLQWVVAGTLMVIGLIGLVSTLAGTGGSTGAIVVLLSLFCGGGWWWMWHRLGRRAVDRTLTWPRALPFALEGFRRWLVDWEDMHFEYLWISFRDQAPRQLVEDAVAAVVPDAALSWLDPRRLCVKLDGLLGVESAFGSGFVPDLARLRKLVSRVLVPLHGSYPVEGLEVSREGLQLRAARLVRELWTRGSDLADDQQGLDAAALIAELSALRRQADEPWVEQQDRDELLQSSVEGLARALVRAEQVGDDDGARLLRDTGAAWGADWFDSLLSYERMSLETAPDDTDGPDDPEPPTGVSLACGCRSRPKSWAP